MRCSYPSTFVPLAARSGRKYIASNLTESGNDLTFIRTYTFLSSPNVCFGSKAARCERALRVVPDSCRAGSTATQCFKLPGGNVFPEATM